MAAATCHAVLNCSGLISPGAPECRSTPPGRHLPLIYSLASASGLGRSTNRLLGWRASSLNIATRLHLLRSNNGKRQRVIAQAADGENVAVSDKTSLQTQLKEAIAQKDTDGARVALDGLKGGDHAKLWSSYSNVSSRTTFIRELTQLGLKNAENLAIPSVRNDAAFLATVVGVTSVLAVIAGQVPGDWGFFVPYLLGGVSLAVLAVGSTAPGLLEAAIGIFSGSFKDTKERVLRHEAAHFLVAYLVGLPVVGYSLDLGKEHTNLVNEKLQRRIYEGTLETNELDRLAAVSMAGLAAEGLTYDKVVGQSADLFSLQRLFNRAKPPLSNNQQQNLTRWAVLYAATLLKNNDKAYNALMEAMKSGAPVEDCIAAIESA